MAKNIEREENVKTTNQTSDQDYTFKVDSRTGLREYDFSYFFGGACREDRDEYSWR